ncbi:MAG: UDP-N-acetylmuramoyl-L-alanyl-D-glutamate--2,6-diaminopimelate ligase [Cyanobacteria bacterium K_DeepCast_35m_m2_023]|nr:UDP-N-acetylmuramoyl-L-alanyl-D-glutamate--2,6-diaminopimelate ligase [Cyanobacteria bacterium K_DeepCast_35m_m2_023]
MAILLHPLLRQVGLEPPPSVANGPVNSISCDSRRQGPGSLFVGIEGTQVDGGQFWPQALAAGACAAVISEAAAAQQPPGSSDAVLVVASPMARWAGELAAAFWQQPSQRMSLLGVTGTNGKTTTTHLIEHLSSACGHPSALFGTLVNRWPGHSVTAQHTTAFADVLQALLAQALEAGAQIGAMEVSSHALDQQRVAGTRFSGAVFTNLTQDHLDYHPSMESYFAAKCALFDPALLTAGTRAIVNGDDPWGARLAAELGPQRCWRSSLDPSSDAELRMDALQFDASGVRGTLISPLGQGQFSSPLVGRFNLMNQLQAVGVLLQQGLPLEGLLQHLAHFRGVPGRMERVSVASQQPLPAVLVDYAHTPDGLDNALRASRPFTQGQLICVFGCGGDRDRSKRPQMGAIAARLADRVVVTSDNPRSEDPQQILDDVVAGIPADCDLQVDGDRARAIACAIAAAGVDDLVLIAGKGHEDYQILGSGKIHFDDREEAETALRKRLH